MRASIYLQLGPSMSSHILSHPLTPIPSTLNRSLSLESETVAGADRIVVAASVLAEVGVVRLPPLLGVEGAVGTVGNVVLAQEISIEEGAGVKGTIGARVAAVVRSVGSASRRAKASIVDTGEVLDAHIGVLAGSAEGGVDGTTELNRAVEAGDWVGWVVLGIAVGASNHNVEVSAPLALVLGGLRCDA